MGHQYRLNYQEMGMRRIFPIVLIRGLPIPVEQDAREVETPDERAETSSSDSSDLGTPSTSSPSTARLPPPRVPVSACRRIRRLKRPRSSSSTQPLRRSPRLNQARQQ
ncbi:Hypothetical protein NTJ_06512 [Nesidiocoris tenuis]|uniref:Uncharacterized protein n=1 Tax=Nesidiocoris tenuis TaxID=355587 RepID=A0ABN7AN97_9HEMI|nr:Hypothetical protein NTJ_06512 [Nesidiocoris tenuis]